MLCDLETQQEGEAATCLTEGTAPFHNDGRECARAEHNELFHIFTLQAALNFPMYYILFLKTVALYLLFSLFSHHHTKNNKLAVSHIK